MTEVNQTISSFIGGVSQQSPVLRLPNQSELEVNTHATITDGLMKRPNTDLTKVIGAIAGADFKMHKIDRDILEKYIVLLTGDATNPVRVYDLDGVEKTVEYGRYTDEDNETFVVDSNVKSYLTAGITSPKQDLKAVTVADYTFIVNSKKVVAMTADVTAEAEDVAYLYIKTRYDGSCSVTYHWEVDSVAQSYTVNYSGAGSQDTVGLATWFKNSFNNYFSGGLFTTTSEGSVLKAVPLTGVDSGSLYITSTDPYGDHGFIPINDHMVDKLADLPASMPNDILLKVGGDVEDGEQEDFYMSFTLRNRTWIEDRAPGSVYKLDESTMPHCLIRKSDGTFRFARMHWVERYVGDDVSNPQPSFVGETIANIGFGKNRLWMLSKDNIAGSKAGEYFDFFGSTVMDVLDSDPIDVSAASEQVNLLRAMKIFDKGILLFSNERQFSCSSGDQPFTPKAVAADETTAYGFDPATEPLKLGSDIYFVSPRTDYLAVREYMIMPDTLASDAPDITSHVSKYIPTGEVQMFGCNTMDCLFLHTSGLSSTLFAHFFLWNESKKVMQSWRKWTFEKEIIGFQVFGTVLHILFYDAVNGYSLHKMRLENTTLAGLPFRLNLDGLTLLTDGALNGDDTEFTLPESCGVDPALYQLVKADTYEEYTGAWTLNGTTLSVTAEDMTEQSFYFGRRYTAQYRFGQPFMRRDDSEQAYFDGRLTWRKLILHFKDTGYFKVAISSTGRDTTYEPVMTGVRVAESVIGAIKLLSGEQAFAIHGDQKDCTVEIQSDSYLPFYIPMGIKKMNFNSKGATG